MMEIFFFYYDPVDVGVFTSRVSLTVLSGNLMLFVIMEEKFEESFIYSSSSLSLVNVIFFFLCEMGVA